MPSIKETAGQPGEADQPPDDGTSSTKAERPVGQYSFVVAASRLPVDRAEGPDGQEEWRSSPGGLVTALEPVMREAGGAWVGWPGAAGEAPEPFDLNGMHLVSVGLSPIEVREYYEGFCNATLWPLYHDVIAQPELPPGVVGCVRPGQPAVRGGRGRAGRTRRDRMGARLPAPAGPGHAPGDAQRRVHRPLHAHPVPRLEIFAQLPWRRQIVVGLLGADLLGFQRHSDATNFLRACRRSAGLATHGSRIHVPDPLPTGGAAAGPSVPVRPGPPAAHRGQRGG